LKVTKAKGLNAKPCGSFFAPCPPGPADHLETPPRLGTQRHAMKEGDVIDCPASDASTAHQLVNTSDTELRCLAVSAQIDPEVCEYPDSGKIGACCGDDDKGLAHLSRSADRVHYWDDQ
jgi:uncharacterized cupin superfamily protein